MKKSFLIAFGLVLAIGATSCFQHRVCATYVKEDGKKIEKTEVESDNI